MKTTTRIYSSSVAPLGVALLALLLSGCANLAAVRDFAKQSESLAAYRGIPGDFVDTNVRMHALYGREETQEELAPYKEHQTVFEGRQTVLVKYMGSLASLADGDVISFQKEIGEAAAAASKAEVMSQDDASLFASAANLAAKIATDSARRRHLREIVSQCDPAIQKLVSVMAETVIEDYRASLRREAQAIDSLLLDVRAAQNPGLTRLTGYAMREHRLAIAKREKAAEAFAQALGRVAQGHAKLKEHIGNFSAKEFIAEIKGYESELKALHNQLKA